MFDADNLVSANFLREVDRYAQAGHRAVQGYLDVKNPGDTWISLSYAIGYWYTNRFWDLARSNIGLASMLGGTGSCMAMSLVDEIGWHPHSITEARCSGSPAGNGPASSACAGSTRLAW